MEKIIDTIAESSATVGNLVAFLALIVAIIAAWKAHGQLKSMNKGLEIQRSMLQNSSEKERKSQASQISSWLTSKYWHTFATVKNPTNSSVFDVKIEVGFRSKDQLERLGDAPLEIKTLPPGEYVFSKVYKCKETNEFYYRNPHKPSENMIAEEYQKKSGWSTAFNSNNVPTSPVLNSDEWRVKKMSFTDSNGIQWERDDNGLKELKA